MALFILTSKQLNSFSKETTDIYSNASEKEIKLGKYLYIAQAIIHECNHAKQYKKVAKINWI